VAGRLSLIRYLLLFNLTVLVTPFAAACGPFPVEDGTFCFFDHRIVANPLFSSCFQIHKGRFDSGMPGRAVNFELRPEIEAEWQTFAGKIGGAVPLAELIYSGDAEHVRAMRDRAAAAGEGQLLLV